jgi:hypothetical protein
MTDRPATSGGLLTWVLRAVLAAAALAAPVITFKAFTDADTPDPVRQQRLREAHDGSEPGPDRSRGTTPDPHPDPRP